MLKSDTRFVIINYRTIYILSEVLNLFKKSTGFPKINLLLKNIFISEQYYFMPLFLDLY